LYSGQALFILGKAVDCPKPFPKRQMSIMKNSASSQRSLVATVPAMIKTTSFLIVILFTFALGADKTMGPKVFLKDADSIVHQW
jgi:hypothetical protein